MNRDSQLRKFLLTTVLAAMFGVGGWTDVRAADHFVSADTSTVDCETFGGGVRPGDTITLRSGTRDELRIQSCIGTATNPIVVRNDRTGSGPTIIRRTSAKSGGFVFTCNDCKHVSIDGSAKWSGAPSSLTYGIKVTSIIRGDSPSTYLMMTGESSNFSIRNVEIDGTWPKTSIGGIGIQVNDNRVLASENPGKWRENILIENTYVHDVHGEGLYVGPNYRSDGLPLRSIEIRNNIVRRTGWDCINAKMMRERTNSIHHNEIRDCGIGTDGAAGQHNGIACYESTGCRIYSNRVENTGETGINCVTQFLPRSTGSQTCSIFNNVVINTGITGPTDADGIAILIVKDGADINGEIYNNTIVGTEANCVAITSVASAGIVRNNILTDCGASSTALPNSVTESSNLTGSSSSVGFVDRGQRNLRLRSDSAAIDTITSGYPVDDIGGVARPQNGIADQGAYEHVLGAVVTVPRPPTLTE